MSRKKKKWNPRHGPKPDWRDRLPDRAQAERYALKEAQKAKEVVDCVFRIIVPNGRTWRAMELETSCTREELALLQAAHAKDVLIINYIREPG